MAIRRALQPLKRYGAAALCRVPATQLPCLLTQQRHASSTTAAPTPAAGEEPKSGWETLNPRGRQPLSSSIDEAEFEARKIAEFNMENESKFSAEDDERVNAERQRNQLVIDALNQTQIITQIAPAIPFIEGSPFNLAATAEEHDLAYEQKRQNQQQQQQEQYTDSDRQAEISRHSSFQMPKSRSSPTVLVTQHVTDKLTELQLARLLILRKHNSDYFTAERLSSMFNVQQQLLEPVLQFLSMPYVYMKDSKLHGQTAVTPAMQAPMAAGRVFGIDAVLTREQQREAYSSTVKENKDQFGELSQQQQNEKIKSLFSS